MNDDINAGALVEGIIAQLDEAYIFPDRAAKARDLLRARLGEGAYNLPASPELCERINADLLEACSDKHLRLLWYESAQDSQDEAALVEALRETIRAENYGIHTVERLAGNIGRIALTIIPEASAGGAMIAAAMQLVHNTQALILDLREARGGAPDGVNLLCSYFFPDGEVHLTDVIEGPNGPARQFWTSSYVPGPRYLDRPVYVLTSGKTFSGGEAAAYDLQAHGRATVVGEVTRGGAHPSTMVSLSPHIELRLPVARSISPITGGNWEAVGVQPDIPATADDALRVAHREALKMIAAGEGVPHSIREEARKALDEAA